MSQIRIEWMVVALWMGLIFVVSTDLGAGVHTASLILPLLQKLFPHASLETLGYCHFLIRKAGHVTEYAVLALLVGRALRDTWHLRWSWCTAGLAILIAATYAAGDEFHQSFVPSRGPSAADVGIDTAGACLGLALGYVFRRRKAEEA